MFLLAVRWMVAFLYHLLKGFHFHRHYYVNHHRCFVPRRDYCSGSEFVSVFCVLSCFGDDTGSLFTVDETLLMWNPHQETESS